jgi:Bax protein
MQRLFDAGVVVPLTVANSVVIPELAPTEPPRPGRAALHMQPPDARSLLARLDDNHFHLAAVRLGARVPRVFVAAVPPDIGVLQSVEDKRNAFIRAMLPLILGANERIAAERLYLRELRLRRTLERRLRAADQAWLAALAQRYKVKEGDWDALLERVDEIPVSMALAQTILESGWGSSAVARKLNSVFGQIGGDGSDPTRHAVFSSLEESVAAYTYNLNVHPAYAAFRSARARSRAEGKPLDGHALAGTLLAYSELGAEYTRNVQALIASENLVLFDSAQLADAQ